MVNANGSRAAVGIISVIAIIGSLGGVMVAITTPMHQRVSTLEALLKSSELRQDYVNRANTVRFENDDIREREDQGQFAAMSERINSVETKNDIAAESEVAALNRLHAHVDKLRDWQADHDKRVRGLNAAQWERIRAIERKVFGNPGPNGGYDP